MTRTETICRVCRIHPSYGTGGICLICRQRGFTIPIVVDDVDRRRLDDAERRRQLIEPYLAQIDEIEARAKKNFAMLGPFAFSAALQDLRTLLEKIKRGEP